jgi:hypothetical protein
MTQKIDWEKRKDIKTMFEEVEKEKKEWGNDLWKWVQKIHAENRATYPMMTIFIRKLLKKQHSSQSAHDEEIIGILEGIVNEIGHSHHETISDLPEHEFVDTCVVFKKIHDAISLIRGKQK